MKTKTNKENDKIKQKSRRKFLKTAAIAGGTAGVLGFPAVMRVSAAAPITLKMQTAWDAGTLGYVKFKEFCDAVGPMTEGQLVVEGFPAGAIAGTVDSLQPIITSGDPLLDYQEKLLIVGTFSGAGF